MAIKSNILQKDRVIMIFDFLCHFKEDCQFSRILVLLDKSFVFFLLETRSTLMTAYFDSCLLILFLSLIFVAWNFDIFEQFYLFLNIFFQLKDYMKENIDFQRIFYLLKWKFQN
jgi:hypothetical protein